LQIRPTPKSARMALHIPARLRSGDARRASPMPGRLKEFITRP